jgi:hypothetical protein
MKRTTAPNSVGGLHVDRVAGVTPGTIGVAEDRNNLQEEVAHPVELLGLALDNADQYQLEKAIIGLSKPVGELFELALEEAPVSWSGARNNSNPANPRYLPAVKLWDSDHDLAIANYPLLVPKLRAEKAKSWTGAAYQTDHSVTVAGSVATGSGTAWDYLLDGLTEEQQVHGSYTNWRCLNIAGVDYAITNVNRASHTITVSGSPATGAQTAILYLYRIAGSTTTARLFKDSGRATMTPDGITYVSGMRRRDRMQGHYHELVFKASASGQDGSNTAVMTSPNGTVGVVMASNNQARSLVTDGANGTPRTGPTTDPAAAIVYRYMWAGVYA